MHVLQVFFVLLHLSIINNVSIILKATLMAEWTTKMEFDRLSTAQVNGMVNAQNLSVVLGISLRTTKRDLYVLRDMNLIHYVGSDKTGHWEVIQ